jgi:hypothetical protein
MIWRWVVICLGNEPLAFGPFDSELEADEYLEAHAPLHLDGSTTCNNGIEVDDHHVLEMTP